MDVLSFREELDLIDVL